MSQDQQKETVRGLFAQYDSNGDGTITVDELIPILKAVTTMKDADIHKMFRQMDKDNSGSLEVEEFVNWVFGKRNKMDARAKAALIPTDASKLQLSFYKFCGPTAIDLDGRGFTKLCKDCKLVNKTFTATEADIIFSKVKDSPGQRRISFEQFEKALRHISDKSNVDLDVIIETVEDASGPAFAGTQADSVRLHDDKENYTGCHGSDGRHGLERSGSTKRMSGVEAEPEVPKPKAPSQDRIRELFAQYDTNGDGTITLDELLPILKSVTNMKDADIRKMFLQMDKDGSGSLEVEEFISWVFSNRNKMDARAKAALIPSDASTFELSFYNFCGPTTVEMDGRSFSKLCKDCKFIGKKFTTTDADLVFSKVILPGQRRMSFTQFEKALVLVAEKSDGEVEEFRGAVAAAKPEFAGTQLDNVRLHDDKSLYTGTHGEGPSRSLKGGSSSASPTRSQGRGSTLAQDVFKSFCGSAQGLDGRNFTKLCKDSGLLDRTFTANDADVVFAKVMPKGQRRIDFEHFEKAMTLIAEKKGVEFDEVDSVVSVSGGPTLRATTADSVRFHDDRSTYTGRHR